MSQKMRNPAHSGRGARGADYPGKEIIRDNTENSLRHQDFPARWLAARFGVTPALAGVLADLALLGGRT